MADAELRDRANEVIDRLFALDDAIANAHAFCALLKDLNARDISAEKPHIAAMLMVRAGILRAAIGTIMACLDPKDWRGNRASVGQILDAFKDTALVDYLASAGQGSTAALQQARERYEALQKDELYERGKMVRHEVVAHNLIRETGDALTPLAYGDIYKLADIAESIAIELYAACGRGKPSCLDWRDRSAEQAKVFWDTYFLGMGSA
jgi:hypothetical protein